SASRWSHSVSQRRVSPGASGAVTTTVPCVGLPPDRCHTTTLSAARTTTSNSSLSETLNSTGSLPPLVATSTIETGAPAFPTGASVPWLQPRTVAIARNHGTRHNTSSAEVSLVIDSASHGVSSRGPSAAFTLAIPLNELLCAAAPATITP